MTELELHFADDYSLEKIVFSYPTHPYDLISIRGKTAGAYRDCSSFQWTPAVRALTLLFLQTAAYSDRKSELIGSSQVFSGATGSLAASIDYAIAKEPRWLTDVFGIDASGRSIVRRLVIRTNPERKRGGNVAVAVNPRVMRPGSVRCFNNGKEITDRKAILELVKSIMNQDGRPSGLPIEEVRKPKRRKKAIPARPAALSRVFPKALEDNALRRSSVGGRPTRSILDNLFRDDIGCLDAPFPFSNPEAIYRLKRAFETETSQMLSSTDIFGLASSKRILEKISIDPTFRGTAGHSASLEDFFDFKVRAMNRFGVTSDSLEFERHLFSDQPVKFAVSPHHAGSLAILYFMKYIKGYHISINFEYAHTVEMLYALRESSLTFNPDIYILTASTFASLVGSHQKVDYHSYMFMPKQSHRIIAPKTNQGDPKLSYGEYCFMHETPTTDAFYFEDLVRSGAINKKEVAIREADPTDVIAILRDGDPNSRSVSSFPHYHFNLEFNNCVALSSDSFDCSTKDTIAMAHQSFLANEKRATAVNVAIRNAWLEIREDRELLEVAVGILLSDSCYLKFLTRATGAYLLQQPVRKETLHQSLDV